MLDKVVNCSGARIEMLGWGLTDDSLIVLADIPVLINPSMAINSKAIPKGRFINFEVVNLCLGRLPSRR